MQRSIAQVVTNLRVNDRMRPTKAFIDELENDIWICTTAGPLALALEKGLSVVRLKKNLSGRVGHLCQADLRFARRLRGRLCGIDWKQFAPGK